MPVWDADGTTNDQVGLVLDSAGKLGARFDYRGRRRLNSDVAPTVAAGTAAGTSPTISVAGTDEFGVVTITLGTSPTTGTLATVTFAQAYGTTPICIGVTQNDTVAALQLYANATTTALTIGNHTASPTAGTYKISYQIVGGA
jgi:hypothetical protein